MTRPRNLPGALAVLGLALTAAPAAADDDDKDRSFRARLSGYNEVHFSGGPPATLRGAVSTKARGTFRATLDRRSDVIHYKLSHEGLEGVITQAHIHFGQHHSVGGITVWLCQTVGTPAPAAVAAATPQCVTEGTVSGTITPAQVLAAAGQGLEAGEFAELVRAMRAGATYANVHSTLFPPGEIRGQIRADDD
jgi:hypothetical protein